MKRIVQLDAKLANMIAAGEVVERPSSVVKELLENSLDAHSTKIDINVVESGIKEITVKDNGDGMSEEDAIMCFSRHATSKIKNEYDLLRISTLGFRGEAIPSISSVSKFTLLTSDSESSTKIVYEYGSLSLKEEAAINKGTEIKVENLFLNVPARLKYLKTLPQEFSSISFLVSRYILANPDVSFSLTSNDRLVYKTSGNNDIKQIFGQLYGLDVARNIIEADYQGKGYKIHIYTTKPAINRTSKNDISLIVNKRYVRSNIITQAVIEAYKSYMPENRAPISLIKLDIDPISIDVNVHPQKMQIKISNEYEIASNITKMIREKLEEKILIPTPILDSNKEYQKEDIFTALKNEEAKEKEEKTFDFEKVENKKPTLKFEEDEFSFTNLKEEKIEEPKKEEFPSLRYIGSVHATYLLFESKDGLYIMDQHAAAERINYEYYLDVLKNPSKEINQLLVPIDIDFTENDFQGLLEVAPKLLDLGFKISEAGPRSIFVREIPSFIHFDDVEDFIRSYITNYKKDKDFNIEKYRDTIAKQIACKASIKANNQIMNQEVDILVKRLSMCKNPFSCPHGRPTIIKFSSYDLEKLFMRVM